MATGKRVKLLRARTSETTPWDSPVASLQATLAARGMKSFDNGGGAIDLLGRAATRLHLMRRIADVSNTAYFAAIMQISEPRLFPVCYFAETIVYAMDVWPAKYEQWRAFFGRHRMRLAFVSARQSADRLRGVSDGLETVWLPEAVDPAQYDGSKPIAARSIDVLEFGRRYEPYHDAIAGRCVEKKYLHRFEQTPGEVIFPTRRDFLAALGDSKIAVCFPSSLTHPKRSGDVETMTLRYVESIAARCILVGRCPAEMRDLFGYNPVVEADMNDPAGQLDAILARPSAYEELIERNYRRLLEVATWDVRVDELLAALGQRGYTI